MGQCASCHTPLRGTELRCHSCGAAVGSEQLRKIPTLSPLDGLEEDESFQTIVTQRGAVSPPPKTLPMVPPPPFTPPPQVARSAPSPLDEPIPARVQQPEVSDDPFASGLGDFTEIADQIIEEPDEPELPDHTVDLEADELYSLDGEADLSPFPTAELTSLTPQRPKLPTPPAPPPSAQGLLRPPPLGPETSPIPKPPSPERPEQPGLDGVVSSLLIMGHGVERVALKLGSQAFGSQHDPTGGQLDELYAHHFEVQRDPAGVTLKPVSTDAELWLRVAGREGFELGEVIRVGHMKLALARSDSLFSALSQVSPLLPLAHAAHLSLLVFNSAGLLEGVFPLHEGVTRIGRSCADINIADPSINLSHLALLLEEGQVTLVDLGGESGLWRQVHQPVTLKRGAVFCAGHTLFIAR